MPSEETMKKKISLTFFVEEKSGRKLQSDEGLVDSVKRKYYDYIYENGCSNCEVIVETHDPGAVKKDYWVPYESYDGTGHTCPFCRYAASAFSSAMKYCPGCGARLEYNNDPERTVR